MEADFRSLTLGKTQAGQVYTGQTASYNWNAVKENAGITLLSSRHPSGGMCYKIVEQYATAYERQIYPTSTYQAKDGNTEVERDATKAYAEFETLVSTGVGTPTEAGIYSFQATSFEDLDTKLSSGKTMSKDLVIELQRTGVSDTGVPKKTLDLRYPESAVMWDKSKLLEDASIYYRSYPKAVRIAALKDMRESILLPFMEPNVMAEIIRANRQIRAAYQQSEYEGSLNDFSSNSGTPLLPDSTYASFTVRFIDQRGDEVKNLPYIAAVRGAINFRESYLRTNAGKDPANFASGATLFEGSDEASEGVHKLYRYKINEEVPHRGSFKVQIILPEHDKTSPWANSRLKVYAGSPETVNDRGSIIETKAGTVLTSQAFTFKGSGSRMEVQVPVYLEPIPNHLVMDENGNLVSKWSTITDVNKMPSHQKVRLKVKLSRLKHSLMWENADKNADGVISQDEYQSPEGEAARADMDLDSKIPVRDATLELRPSQDNAWLSARNTITSKTDLSGTATLTVPVGAYTLVMVSQDESGEPIENSLADIEVPAAVFFRNTSPHDTTPLGIVGATIKDSRATLTNFNLTTHIAPLPEGKSAEYGTVYAMKELPGIQNGWPSSLGTQTSESIFDSFEVLLAPLPSEIVLTGQYEDIEEQEVEEEALPFNASMTLTQANTGSIVTGIDQTPAGTKWKITRIAIRSDTEPMVTFANQYNPSQPVDAYGRNNYAEASILYQKAQTMAQGEEYIVFQPLEQGSIVAYPTEAVSISTPGSTAEYTYDIEEIPEVVEEEPPVENEPSNALPTPTPPPRIPYGGYYYTIESMGHLGIGMNAHKWEVFSSEAGSQPLITDLSLTGYQSATVEAREYIDSLAVTNASNNMSEAAQLQQQLQALANRNNNVANNVPNNSMLQPVSNIVPPAENWVEPVVINAVLEAENQGDAITANMLTSQAIIDAYRAGTLDYQQAYQQLSQGHGWSNLDITESLDPTSAVFTGNGQTAAEMVAQNNNANTYNSTNNVSDGLPSTIVNQNNTVNTPSATYINMMATGDIINNYGSGNLTYAQAAQQLQQGHGWSQTDVDNSLGPLYNNHQAAVAAAASAAAEANRFARLQQQYWEESAASNNTTDNGCYITTAVMRSEGHDESPELQSMRALRDNYGIKHFKGEVEEYYEIAPSIVSGISSMNNSDAIFKELYHKFIVPAHELVKAGKYDDAHSIYRNMVRRTQHYGGMA